MNSFSRRTCIHCGQRTRHWRWRLIEVYPACLFEVACTACIAAQDASFTPASAIVYAMIVIGMRQVELAEIGGAR